MPEPLGTIVFLAILATSVLIPAAISVGSTALSWVRRRRQASQLENNLCIGSVAKVKSVISKLRGIDNVGTTVTTFCSLKCAHNQEKKRISVKGNPTMVNIFEESELEWNNILLLVSDLGHVLDEFLIDGPFVSEEWPLPAYSWYPTDCVEELIRTVLETTTPMDFIRSIGIVIPPNCGIEYPKILSEEKIHICKAGNHSDDVTLTWEKYALTSKSTNVGFEVFISLDKSDNNRFNGIRIIRNNEQS